MVAKSFTTQALNYKTKPRAGRGTITNILRCNPALKNVSHEKILSAEHVLLTRYIRRQEDHISCNDVPFSLLGYDKIDVFRLIHCSESPKHD